MFRLTNPRKILVLIVLVLGFGFSARAQEDCVYGYKIYVRDETGKAVENGKLEVSGLNDTVKLPPNANYYVDKSGVYNINGAYGSTIKGAFRFKISAEGFETYERQFNFPVCEIQSFELRLRAEGSTDKASYERLFRLHGKVFDEERKPFGNAKVEAESSGGRVYQTYSNAYGYYEIDLPKGVTNVRVSDGRIPDVVFENYRIEKNYSVLNVAVCLKCGRKQSEK